MIELRNLTKKFGEVIAVNHLNLSISKGEIFGFIGPNGAGKTTTLRMMGGVLLPTEGTITIDGIPMAERPEQAKRRIGYIPDRPFLYEKLTGMEFLRFTADLFGTKDGEFRPKTETVLRRFSLHDWKDELIQSYSHGMKQRLVLCAAILHDPKVLVIDEPMVGLDPSGIRMVKNLFKDLARRGTTIFMSTHSLSVAEDVCDRIGIIHQGLLIKIGTLEELKRSAQVRNGDLEQVFLILTEGGSIR